MSDTKEFTKRIERKIIKIGVIIQYGKDNAEIISHLLRCENTNQKLLSIQEVHKLDITPEQKLFIIQKLLAYPKATRISIANQIDKRINKWREEYINESNY